MDKKIKTHICVIGAGSGGLVIASGAAQLGVDVTLIEREKMGGDCLNYGCVPSKALLSASREIKGSFKKVMDHVHSVIKTIEPHDSVARFQGLGVRVILGDARFKDAHHIEVGEFEIEAKYIVIATGSEAAVPGIMGLSKVPYFTNKTMFDMKAPPKHLGIIGGGPIGVEMAQAFSNLGSKVSLVQHGRILPRDDDEAVDVVREALVCNGVNFHEYADVLEVSKKGKNIELELPASKFTCSHLLIAAGRKPSIEALELDKIGIKYYKVSGIYVNAKMQTNKSHIYAIGDAAMGPSFTHTAGYQAGIVLRNILFKLPAKVNFLALPWVTYTKPELAQVGLTEDHAKAQYSNIRIIKEDFQNMDRALTDDTKTGFVKIMATSRGRVVGATIVGPHAGDLIQIWCYAIQNKVKLSKIAGMIAPYPTLSEINKRVAGKFYEAFIFGSFMKRLVKFLSRF